MSFEKNTKSLLQTPLSVLFHNYSCYAAFDDAVLKGLIASNPVRDTKVTNKKSRDFSEEMLFLTEDEIRKMLCFLDEHYPFLKPIAFVGVYYGLRWEEILGLEWNAINYENRELTIRHTVTWNRTIYAEDKTKSKKRAPHTEPLPDS